MLFSLPDDITPLVDARNGLRQRYSATGLRFTFDGNLVGDIGEAIAAERFQIELVGPGNRAIDGHAPDRRSVQVKASGTGRGPFFLYRELWADHLLFFSLNFELCNAEVSYNGPMSLVRQYLPATEWKGPRTVTMNQVRAANVAVADTDRLKFIQ